VTALIVGLTVAVALLALLVMGLLRGQAEVLRALYDLGVDLDPTTAGSARRSGAQPVAVAAPGIRPTPTRPASDDIMDLNGTTPSGDAVSLAVGDVRHDTLVAFLTSGCATCRGFWDAFRNGPPEVPGGARLVTVTRGSEAESPGAIAALAGSAPVVMSSQVWDHYDVPYAPYFVYISGPGGRVVGEGVAAGWSEVQALVANAVADGTTGDPIPRPASGSRARSRGDRERDDAVDRQLRAAGIEPGDPRLHPTSLRDGATGS
jgi:hypothetical protein